MYVHFLESSIIFISSTTFQKQNKKYHLFNSRVYYKQNGKIPYNLIYKAFYNNLFILKILSSFHNITINETF